MLKERVNIQYSIDMEELPHEVSRLLSKSKEAIKSVINEHMEKLSFADDSELLSIKTIETIEDVRRALSAADYILNDTTNIIDGFVRYKMGDKKEQPTIEEKLPEMPPEFRNPELLSDEVTMAELRSKIENYKASTSDRPPSTP